MAVAAAPAEIDLALSTMLRMVPLPRRFATREEPR
jgi:hypothetical protein